MPIVFGMDDDTRQPVTLPRQFPPLRLSVTEQDDGDVLIVNLAGDTVAAVTANSPGRTWSAYDSLGRATGQKFRSRPAAVRAALQHVFDQWVRDILAALATPAQSAAP